MYKIKMDSRVRGNDDLGTLENRILLLALEFTPSGTHHCPMPIYEYAATAKGCDHCTGHFDVLQKSKDDPLTKCPQCGAEVARVISAPSFAMGNAHTLKESNVEKHGFTQYRR